MAKVGAPEVILHRRPGASRVDVRGTKMRDGIVVMNRPEVYAVTGDAAGVRHRLVQLGPGKQDEASRRTNYFDRIGTDLFLRLWLFPGVGLDMLGRFHSTFSIPLRVIINLRIVPDRGV